MGRFEDGHKKLGGRPKGTPNKFTASIRDAFREAFDRRGGVDALLAWADENPDEFYRLIGKMIPLVAQVDASGTMTLQVVTNVPDKAE